jgi:cystathionine beta-lyase/cystathionine gamma-synthase
MSVTGAGRTFEPIGGEFGISVELATLKDVIDCVEGAVTPVHGYPRFVPHRVVTALEDEACRVSGLPHAVAFPSKRQALFVLCDFLHRTRTAAQGFSIDTALDGLIDAMFPGRGPVAQRWTDTADAKVVEVGPLTAICTAEKADGDAIRMLRRVWGTGFDVHALAGKQAAEPAGFGEERLTDEVSLLEGPKARGALLFQSGMAAITTLVLAGLTLKRRFVLIGPAYVDTGAIASRWTAEVPGLDGAWLPGDAPLPAIEAELAKGQAIVFFELPTNPLLTVPDVDGIRAAARRHGAIIGADATIATPFNWRPLDEGLDFTVHSTSKFLGGRYNHLGGVIATPSTELLALFKKTRDALDFGMCRNQMRVLFANLAGFRPRMEAINAGAREIASRLARSPSVATVHYPGSGSNTQERLAATHLTPGRSGLISFILKDGGVEALQRFYDAVRAPVRKGLGLGGETSLVCPYVMIAHYQADPAFLVAQGLHRHLVRLSVGTEPPDEIWKGLGLP